MLGEELRDAIRQARLDIEDCFDAVTESSYDEDIKDEISMDLDKAYNWLQSALDISTDSVP